MKFRCTSETDIDEMVGYADNEGFHYGPLATAMRQGDLLELEASALMSALMRAKIKSLAHGVFIVETGEVIDCQKRFQLILH